MFESLQTGFKILDLQDGSPKMFVVFTYTTDGEAVTVLRKDIVEPSLLAEHIASGMDVPFIEDGNDDESSSTPPFPLLMFFYWKLWVPR